MLEDASKAGEKKAELDELYKYFPDTMPTYSSIRGHTKLITMDTIAHKPYILP